MRLSPVILLTALAILASGGVRAEPVMPGELQLDTVEKQIESSKAAQDRLAADIALALAEQEAVVARLVAISARLRAQEEVIAAGEAEILRLNREEIVILADLAAKQDVLSELLAGLQRLEQNPPPALVVEPNDVLAALRGAMMFGTIVPEMRARSGPFSPRQLAPARHDPRRHTDAERNGISPNIARLEPLARRIEAACRAQAALMADPAMRLEAEQDARRRTGDQGQVPEAAYRIAGRGAPQGGSRGGEAGRSGREPKQRRQEAGAAQAAHWPSPRPAAGSTIRPRARSSSRFGEDDGFGGKVKGVSRRHPGRRPGRPRRPTAMSNSPAPSAPMANS